jgi:hypothetical protein
MTMAVLPGPIGPPSCRRTVSVVALQLGHASTSTVAAHTFDGDAEMSTEVS